MPQNSKVVFRFLQNLQANKKLAILGGLSSSACQSASLQLKPPDTDAKSVNMNDDSPT